MSPLVCWKEIEINQKMQHEAMWVLYSLRCKQCLAWLRSYGKQYCCDRDIEDCCPHLPIAMLPCYADFFTDKTCSSLLVSAESDGFASPWLPPVPSWMLLPHRTDSGKNKCLSKALVLLYWTSLKLHYFNKIIFVFSYWIYKYLSKSKFWSCSLRWFRCFSCRPWT